MSESTSKRSHPEAISDIGVADGPWPQPFAGDVIEGLSRPAKIIPFQYFYDDVGAELFTRIAHQDEYYVTRTETAILTSHAADIAASLGQQVGICELGSGNGAKTRVLLDAVEHPAWYVPVDIAEEQLADTATTLNARYPGLVVEPLLADFTAPFALPPGLPREAKRVLFSPGLTLWNLSIPQRKALLGQIRALVGEGGAALLGVDWTKDVRLLEAAYDDAAGVTAAFNLNVLERINRELGGTIRPELFRHRARWDAGAGRIEVGLEALQDHTAVAAGHSFDFVAGETIVTEHSYKFTPEGLDEVLGDCGWAVRESWSDTLGWMSVVLLTPA